MYYHHLLQNEKGRTQFWLHYTTAYYKDIFSPLKSQLAKCSSSYILGRHHCLRLDIWALCWTKPRYNGLTLSSPSRTKPGMLCVALWSRRRLSVFSTVNASANNPHPSMSASSPSCGSLGYHWYHRDRRRISLVSKHKLYIIEYRKYICRITTGMGHLVFICAGFFFLRVSTKWRK